MIPYSPPRSRFADVPMRFYASPADIVVNMQSNALALSVELQGLSAENTVVSCAGGHGDSSHYQASDVIAFFERCALPARPIMEFAGLAGGQFTLEVMNPKPALPVVIEGGEDMMNWVPLSTNVGGTITYSEQVRASHDRRFYRAVFLGSVATGDAVRQKRFGGDPIRHPTPQTTDSIQAAGVSVAAQEPKTRGKPALRQG